MSRLFALLLTALTLIAAGCAANTRQQLIKSGGTPLSAKKIYTLVSGHSLHLNSNDFEARIYFDTNGTLAARDHSGEKDTGKWDVTSDDRLCFAFHAWYYGDLRCYTLVAAGDKTVVFFTPNGARAYTSRVLGDNPQGLVSQLRTSHGPTFLRGQLSGEGRKTEQEPQASPVQRRPAVTDGTATAPAPSHQEMKHILARTAANCPQCKLTGVDLSESDLAGANLAGANLTGANLTGTVLRRANLAGATLVNARLHGSDLSGANLRDCDLRGADLSGANLLLADFTGARTTGMRIEGAILEDTKGLK